jgi:antitoxin component YwqK of YwqJK toxin-antitoxin module
MRTVNTLKRSDVLDESGKIVPKFISHDSSDWVPNGRYTVLRDQGGLLLEITYRDGLPDGRFIDYWSNGKVASEGQYKDGKREGVWHYYYQDGSIMEILHFKDDKEIT